MLQRAQPKVIMNPNAGLQNLYIFYSIDKTARSRRSKLAGDMNWRENLAAKFHRATGHIPPKTSIKNHQVLFITISSNLEVPEEEWVVLFETLACEDLIKEESVEEEPGEMPLTLLRSQMDFLYEKRCSSGRKSPLESSST